MISVLLVDDHAYVRKSLTHLIETTTDIPVVATASNGLEAVGHAGSHWPDVVVMDISMPLMDGIEATRQIRLHCSHTCVMMLLMFDTQEYIHRALDVDAVGYVLKDEVDKDLLVGIRTLFGGNHFFSQKIARIAEKYLHRKAHDGSAD